jgi:hypothetical protein
MRNWILAAAVIGLTGGCSHFLNDPKAISDPNNPTLATRNQLFAGAQANTFGNEEGAVAMIICEWMQQCGGVNGRFADAQDTYNVDNTATATKDLAFENIYQGGGLVGIRAVEASASADGDLVYKGIAEVLEVMDMMYAADVWGNVPYREAVTDKPAPAFDPQGQIYADLLKLLDQAIADMAGAGAGPGSFDLIYSGNKAKSSWLAPRNTPARWRRPSRGSAPPPTTGRPSMPRHPGRTTSGSNSRTRPDSGSIWWRVRRW